MSAFPLDPRDCRKCRRRKDGRGNPALASHRVWHRQMFERVKRRVP